MFYYGIIIDNEELLEIEALKNNMTKEQLIKHKYEKSLEINPDFTHRKMIKHYKTINNFIVNGLINGDNIFGSYPNPELRTNDILENKRFIGWYEFPEDGGIVPFSLIISLIPEEKQKEINEKLVKYGYGRYKPSLWFNMDGYGKEKCNYTSHQKLI